MTRFCGRCGSMLDATAWNDGRCPHCGAEIETSGNEPGSGADPVADTATRPTVAANTGASAGADALATAGMPFSRAGTTPAHPPTASIPANAGGRQDAPNSRRAPSPWMLALIAVLVVALVGVSVYALTSPRGISIILAPFTASVASASSDSSSSALSSGGSGGTGAQGSATRATNPGGSAAPTTAASPVGTGTIGPSPSGTATVSPTAVPVGTGTVVPIATATATSTPAQAVLSVTPPSFSFTLCLPLATQATFTVANTGGQPLTWTATYEPSSYSLSATSGTLDAGAFTHLKVSNISVSGSVTISAPSAQNSPQTVTITCGV